ncbi:phage tail tape measure protein [Sphingomonas oryzagri]
MADRNLSILIKFAALDKFSAPLRRISGGSSALKRTIAETRGEIGKLGATQARVGKLKALEERFGADTRALAKERAEIERLKKAMASTDGPTANMAKGLANAEKAAGALERRLQVTGNEIGQTSRKLETAGVEVADLARHEDRLANSVYEANQRLQQQHGHLARVEKAGERAAKLQAAAGKLAIGGAAAVGVGTAIGTPLLSATRDAMAFQSSLVDLAQKAGEAGRDMPIEQARRLGDEFLKLSERVNQLPEDVERGADTLLGFGATMEQTRQMLPAVGKAATATGADLNDLAAASYALVSNLGVHAKDTEAALGAMNVAGKAGKVELKDMAQYFPQLAASAAALGTKGVPAAADLAAALEVVGGASGDASQAANNLQNLLAKITSNETVKNFKKMGVDLLAELDKAKKAGTSPIEMIATLTDKALKGNMARLPQLFNDMQVQQALRPLISDMQKYRDIRDAATKGGNSIQMDFDFRMKNDPAAMAKQADVAFARLRIVVGNQLVPWLIIGANKVSKMANAFDEFATAHPVMAKIAAVAAIAAVGLGGMALAAAAMLAPFAALVPIAAALDIGFLPLIAIILAVVAAVAALTAIGVYLYTHWDGVVAKLKALWTGFKNWMAVLGTMLMDGLLMALDPLRLVDKVKRLGKAAINAFKGVLGIHSPSRVFMQLGGFMTEGLARGIDGGGRSAVRSVTRVATSVTTAAVAAIAPVAPISARAAPPRPPASAGETGGSDGNVFHVYGDNPEMIARKVEAVLDRRDREKAARHRSSYRDGEDD